MLRGHFGNMLDFPRVLLKTETHPNVLHRKEIMKTILYRSTVTHSSILVLSILIAAASFGACGGAQCPATSETASGTEPQSESPQSATPQPVPQTSEPGTRDASPQPIDEAAALTRLLTVSPIASEWFDERFQQQVPITSVEKIVLDGKAELGKFHAVVKVDGKYEAKFEKGVMPCSITLDDTGRIAGLWFHPLRLSTASFEDAQKKLNDLAGKVSVLVVDNEGKDLFAIRPDEPLAVGSAFKLAILDAMNQKIGKKARLWQQTISLQEKHRSLPSGQLQKWPIGSALTLSTLSNLMISISDNTATDMLLDWVGRDRIEKTVSHSKPFLSTREAFVLKSASNEELLQRYRGSDEKQRRKILREIASLTLPEAGGLNRQVTSDVEWHFSARELCATIARVSLLPSMQINPGLADKKEFDQIAFKGGSELGVLNFTTWVKKGNRSACVVATWNNDKDIDTRELAKPYRTLLSAARTHLE